MDNTRSVPLVRIDTRRSFMPTESEGFFTNCFFFTIFHARCIRRIQLQLITFIILTLCPSHQAFLWLLSSSYAVSGLKFNYQCPFTHFIWRYYFQLPPSMADSCTRLAPSSTAHAREVDYIRRVLIGREPTFICLHNNTNIFLPFQGPSNKIVASTYGKHMKLGLFDLVLGQFILNIAIMTIWHAI